MDLFFCKMFFPIKTHICQGNTEINSIILSIINIFINIINNIMSIISIIRDGCYFHKHRYGIK